MPGSGHWQAFFLRKETQILRKRLGQVRVRMKGAGGTAACPVVNLVRATAGYGGVGKVKGLWNVEL